MLRSHTVRVSRRTGQAISALIGQRGMSDSDLLKAADHERDNAPLAATNEHLANVGRETGRWL